MINLREEPVDSEVILVHHAREHLERVESREQGIPGSRWEMGVFTKPEGIWVSALGEDDWWEWCSSEMPDWIVDRFPKTTNLILKNDNRVLLMSTPAELDEFTQLFGIADPTFARAGIHDVRINWTAVAALFQGVIVAPYVWERRLDMKTRWYYGWDCASGVIWDASCIERLVPIEDVTVEQLRGKLPTPRVRSEEEESEHERRAEFHH